MNTKPHFNILTLCDYAALNNQRLTIVGTCSYLIGSGKQSKYLVARGWFYNEHPPFTFYLSLYGSDDVKLYCIPVTTVPIHTIEGRSVFQLIAILPFNIIKNDHYSLHINWDTEDGVLIGSLPIPIRFEKVPPTTIPSLPEQ